MHLCSDHAHEYLSQSSIDAYVLDLGGLDIILGMAWLKGLGKVVMDWNELAMNFLFHGKPVQLEGQPCGAGLSQGGKDPHIESASFNNLRKGVSKEELLPIKEGGPGSKEEGH